jgi:hypothetical protein
MALTLSSRNLFPVCESQEWLVNPLKTREENRFEILFPGGFSTLRSCSMGGEQNALSRGIRGPPTETAANRPAIAGGLCETHDSVGILGFAKSPSSECHRQA